MIYLPFEPTVSVCLCENSSFGLSPIGQYNIDGSENIITYIPASTKAKMLVKNFRIGKDFHWDSHRDCSFSGIIQLRRDEDNTSLINLIKAEEYLKSVIGSEMSPDTPLEYMKAHAVISRSWLLNIIANPAKEKLKSETYQSDNKYISFTQNDLHQGFDVCADDHCQRYQGLEQVSELSTNVINETRGLVLIDNESGNVADTRFSKCCGGKSELFSAAWNDINFPYLQPVACEYCDPKQLSRDELEALKRGMRSFDFDTEWHDWQETVKPTLIRENIRELIGRDLGEPIDLVPITRGKSGRIIQLEIRFPAENIIIGKELTIRKILSSTHLKSSAFDIERIGEDFLLHGKGWGHGVGLCQIGALVMAIRGASCEEILYHYYPNTKLTKLYD